MTLEFTTDGLTIQTYQEIFDELVAEYQAIYGTDINVDPDSPDGQRIGIGAKARLDIQTIVLDLYNQSDPDLASGVSLNKIIKLAGITRGLPSRSQVDVTIVTDRDLTLSAGYTVTDDLGQNWITTADRVLTTGSNTVTLVAETFGAISADPNTITEPADVVIGVTSVTNPTSATIGRDEETDTELRVRRNKSLQSPATSTLGGLFSAIGNLTGVTDLVVYENDQDTTDAVRSIAPHTIWCVVEGGVVADIIETIAKNKTGGTGLKGAVTGTYVETLTKPDGTSYDIIHEMVFDRPVDVPIYVTLTVEGTDGAVVDIDGIKNALVAHDFSIADDITAAELYADVYSVASNFTATLLEISDDDITYTDGLLSPGFDGKFSLDSVNITVTDIT